MSKAGGQFIVGFWGGGNFYGFFEIYTCTISIAYNLIKVSNHVFAYFELDFSLDNLFTSCLNTCKSKGVLDGISSRFRSSKR